VEAQNFAVRKHLLEYDDVMNKQRTAVYDMRRMVLEGKNTREYVLNLSKEVLDWYLESYVSGDDPDKWNFEGLRLALKETYGLDVPIDELSKLGRAEMDETFVERIRAKYEEKETAVGPELMLFHQRMIMLQIVDAQWKDHLLALDHLKEGIGLRGYGQRDPLVEYKKESFHMFQALMDRIDEEILRWVYLYQAVPMAEEPRQEVVVEAAARPAPRPEPRRVREPELALAGARPLPRNLTFNNPGEILSGSRSALGAAQPEEPAEAHGGNDAAVSTVRREGKKVGRNDPCPCGSGKKYKKCHGQ
jgi:preprotein translocase subunit SecA